MFLPRLSDQLQSLLASKSSPFCARIDVKVLNAALSEHGFGADSIAPLLGFLLKAGGGRNCMCFHTAIVL